MRTGEIIEIITIIQNEMSVEEFIAIAKELPPFFNDEPHWITSPKDFIKIYNNEIDNKLGCEPNVGKDIVKFVNAGIFKEYKKFWYFRDAITDNIEVMDFNEFIDYIIENILDLGIYHMNKEDVLRNIEKILKKHLQRKEMVNNMWDLFDDIRENQDLTIEQDYEYTHKIVKIANVGNFDDEIDQFFGHENGMFCTSYTYLDLDNFIMSLNPIFEF